MNVDDAGGDGRFGTMTRARKRQRGVGILLVLLVILCVINEFTGLLVEATSSLHPQSLACPFYQDEIAEEYITQLKHYDNLQIHEEHVSAVVSASMSKSTADIGLRITPRSEFAQIHPTDFVVWRVFSCATRSSSWKTLASWTEWISNSCLKMEAPVDDDSMRKYSSEKIKFVHCNKEYRHLELHQAKTPPADVPRMKSESNRRLLGLRHKPKKLIDELGVQELWNRGFHGEDVKIGIFDTGLSDARFQNVKERINWTHEKKNTDMVGHGTFVAGLISGTDLRCPGIAPESELYVFRMFTTDQLSFTSWFLDAFNYALFKGIHVLNLSTGGPDFQDMPFVEKIKELTANGIILVSAVGNSGPKYGTLTNPADQIEVIGVGGITHEDDIADFSSRGMTTWELPFGSGRVKPDIVTLSEDIASADVSRGCKVLSGTSVSAPIISASIALLASMIPPDERWTVLNPASMKQILIDSADRLEPREEADNYVVRNHIFEQGNGKLNITRASSMVLDMWSRHQRALNVTEASGDVISNIAKPSSFPASIDATDCPYMWPLCSQPLYYTSLPLMFNLTIINPVSVSGNIEGPPRWIAASNGEYLAVSVASPDALWPYYGSLGVFVEVKQDAANLDDIAEGSLVLTVKNGRQLDEIIVPIKVQIIPKPAPSKRILWDQFHNIPYPSAFVPRDNLENYLELLDAAGDHPHTNFHQLWNFLIREGFFVEILPFEYSCLDLQLYGVVMVVDPEEEFFHDEITALHDALKYSNVSLIVFADWYDDQILDSMELFDTSTLSNWRPITGGANVPAINSLLSGFNIAFGDGAVSTSAVSLLSGNESSFPYWSGTYITKFPVNGYLGYIDAIDESALALNQSEETLHDVPVLGLYQVPSHYGGRIAVFGDSSCIDASVHPANEFRHCFGMVRSLLQFTTDATLPSSDLQLLELEFISNKPSLHATNALFDSTQKELRNANQPRREEMNKHSKVVRANEIKPVRQTFCHFYRKEQCNLENRMTMQVLE